MKCYVCEKQSGPGGTRYHVRTAVGICHNCGVAVCAEHSYRAPEPGSPLLCPSCAKLMGEQKVTQVAIQDTLVH